jgi:hypothetical protein
MGRATLHATPNPSRVPLFAAPQDTRTVAEIRQAVEEALKIPPPESMWENARGYWLSGGETVADKILARLGLEESASDGDTQDKADEAL